MSKNNSIFSPKLEQLLDEMGKQIKLARLRRKLTRIIHGFRYEKSKCQ